MLAEVQRIQRELVVTEERARRAMSPIVRRAASGTARGLERELAAARLAEWKLTLNR